MTRPRVETPYFDTYAGRFWGWCGTAEAEARAVCPLCHQGVQHPWHHSPGMPPNSEDHELWEEGGPHYPPGH